jgi:hypothetical protein
VKEIPMTKSVLAALTLTAGLMATVGCNNDPNTAPPGPGPTALPHTYKGSDIPPSGPINTESRMGSDRPMQP